MDIEFTLPSCISTGVCSNCGGCSSFKPPEKKVTSDYNADDAGEAAAIIWNDNDPTVWTGGRVHQPVTLTYSIGGAANPVNFFNRSWDAGYKFNYDFQDTWRDFTSNQKMAIRAAAEKFAESTGVLLVEIDPSQNADIEWHYGTASPEIGIVGAIRPDGEELGIGSNLLVNNYFNEYWETVDFRPGEMGFAHLMHEFGHALNLKHPFYGRYTLPTEIENRASTVMSHNQNPDGTFATDLRPLDKQALQYLYGTVEQRAAGGVEQRQWQNDGLISIADDGGRQIIGVNFARDLVYGGGGNDFIATRGGNDWIHLSKGHDTVCGGDGNDTIVIDNDIDPVNLRIITLNNNATIGTQTGIITDGHGNWTYFDSVEFIQASGQNFDLSRAASPTPAQNAVMLTNLYSILFDAVAAQHASFNYHLDLMNAGAKSVDLAIHEFITSAFFAAPTGWADMSVGQKLTALAERAGASSLLPPELLDLLSTTGNLELGVKYLAMNDAVGTVDQAIGNAVSDFAIVDREIPFQNILYNSEAEYNLHAVYNFFGLNPTQTQLDDNIYQLNWFSSSYSEIAGELLLSDQFQAMVQSGKANALSTLAALGLNASNYVSEASAAGIRAVAAMGLREVEQHVFNVNDRDGTGGFFKFNHSGFGEVQASLRSDQIKTLTVDADGNMLIKDWRNDIINLGQDISKIEFMDGTLFVGVPNKFALTAWVIKNFLGATNEGLAQSIGSSIESSVTAAGDIMRAICASSDFQSALEAKYATMSTSQFVNGQYRTVLGRDPLKTEFNAMEARLDGGASKLEVFQEFLIGSDFAPNVLSKDGQFAWHSDEFRELNFRLFEVVLNRSSSYYEEGMKSGQFDPEQVVSFMFASPEYKNSVWSNFGDQAWVNVLHRRTFGEEAAPAKVEFWTDLLAHGMSREELALRFLLSDKHLGDVLHGTDIPYVGNGAVLRFAGDNPDHGISSNFAKALRERYLPDLPRYQGSGEDVVSGAGLVLTIPKDAALFRLSLDSLEYFRSDIQDMELTGSIVGMGASAKYAVSGLLYTTKGVVAVDDAQTIVMRDGILTFDSNHSAVKIEAMVEDLFHRDPTPNERLGWQKLWDSADGLNSVLDGMLSSREYNSRIASLSITEFVKSSYRDVLDREADADGLSAAENALQLGADKAEFVKSLYNSDEYQFSFHVPKLGVWQVDPVAVRISNLYEAILDRAPDRQGLSNYIDAVHQGVSFLELTNILMESAEAAGRFSDGSDADFVWKAYGVALDRQPDEGGFNNAMAVLGRHEMTRAEVLLSIASSIEIDIKNAAHSSDGILFAS